MKQHKILYKTTCLVTSKFYIGIHTTNNLNDGYLGSGVRIRHSIKKYGKHAHSFQVLKTFNDVVSLREAEKDIVNDELLLDPLCLNLKRGGDGGATLETVQKAAKALWDKFKSDEEFAEKMKKKQSLSAMKRPPASKETRSKLRELALKRTHSPETRAKMSAAKKGKPPNNKGRGKNQPSNQTVGPALPSVPW